MSVFTSRPGLRWLVPVGAAGLIVATALITPRVALADPQLPPRTAEELLVALQEAPPAPLAGTVALSADLGLPELPAQAAGASDSPTDLLAGEHTLRVWLDGPDRHRLALLGPASEKVLVHNGTDVWTWSSRAATVDHLVLPESAQAAKPSLGELSDELAGAPLPTTPQEAAELLLTTLDPSTQVTAEGTARVAGRDAYQLELAPRDATTLVDRIVLSMDAETSTPLRYQVFSTKLADPALEVGFSSVEFGTPDPEMFDFTPPPGATVTEHSAQELAAAAQEHAGAQDPESFVAFGRASPLGELPEPQVVGSGWSSVVVATLPADALADLAEQGSAGEAAGSAGSDDGQARSALALLELLPSSTGEWGTGRVLAGTLFTVIVTDDGRVAAGAVPPDAVGDALASTS